MTTSYAQAAPGVYAIDSLYGGKVHSDAIHLIIDSGRAAFVDTGTYHSVPAMLDALRSLGLEPQDVDYILLTHVHLDHAGGASRLTQVLPRATLHVHPRGASHLLDPRTLVAATQAVYGADAYQRLYGEITAIDPARVRTAADGEHVMLGRRRLEFLHTPGHALHHLCIVDRDQSEVYSGDTFGVSYRDTDTAAGAFIFPSTSPSQFDPAQLHASVQKIVDLKPRQVYLTHYSKVTEIDRLGADLHRDIDRFVDIVRGTAASPRRLEEISRQLYDYLAERLDAHGYTPDPARRHAVLDTDVGLNAAGLLAWASRVRS